MSVEIGKHWKPGHRVYRDDSTGSYGEVNSPLLTVTESLVQQALLRPQSPPPKLRYLRARPWGPITPPATQSVIPPLRIPEDQT